MTAILPFIKKLATWSLKIEEIFQIDFFINYKTITFNWGSLFRTNFNKYSKGKINA